MSACLFFLPPKTDVTVARRFLEYVGSNITAMVDTHTPVLRPVLLQTTLNHFSSCNMLPIGALSITLYCQQLNRPYVFPLEKSVLYLVLWAIGTQEL